MILKLEALTLNEDEEYIKKRTEVEIQAYKNTYERCPKTFLSDLNENPYVIADKMSARLLRKRKRKGKKDMAHREPTNNLDFIS